MSASTINISLPESLRAEVDAIIAADGYGNTSEFFRDLVRNHLKERQEKQLEIMLLEGMNSPISPWTKDDVAEIKDELMARISARRGGHK
ncbi:type II toxin-antitoxin system ParD family antitoxin [soil metagenome]